MFIDIVYTKKSVYIHLIKIINVLIEETVSVRVTIQRKNGFRSDEYQGRFQKMRIRLVIFIKKMSSQRWVIKINF